MKYFCNPLNVDYKYQFNMGRDGVQISRESADPSLLAYQGKYYIFASMTKGVYVSSDMANWKYQKINAELPFYDYAPDVCVMGDYVYFSASKNKANCSFYRTQDILNGPYEEISGTFPFWDPNLFLDDDGRVYLYWGCSNSTPLYGVELDRTSMTPIDEKKELVFGNSKERGYERPGEEHIFPLTEEDIEQKVNQTFKALIANEIPMTEEGKAGLRQSFGPDPYIEGAWLNKYNGKYYLQYACAGTEYNIYADGVFEAEQPLGPYRLAQNSPYSYKPGGFAPGAGHGSTLQDRSGNWWHSATLRISLNHQFERRVGLWPAGFDQDGELFCNQRYGDWPIKIQDNTLDPWSDPEWFLLSYRKQVSASSFMEGKEPSLSVDENIRTWWQAATSKPGEWLQVDLGKECDVHAVQINFADDKINAVPPSDAKLIPVSFQPRYIDERKYFTRWLLEGSLDGSSYFILEDKSTTEDNLPHDLVVCEEGIRVRYLKLTVLEVPFEQKACISGLRVFGISEGTKPSVPEFEVKRVSDIDMDISIINNGAVGYNILWGHSEDKLYHSYMIFETSKRIGALVKDQKEYYVRVDAFNEAGITEGKIVKL